MDTAPTSAGYNTYSPDYQYSYDEWYEGGVRTLMEKWSQGYGLPDPKYITPDMGMPNQADFGKGTTSFQTQSFFERWVANSSDPYILREFGAAPTRRATYAPDPNSPSALQDDRQAFETTENAADRELTKYGIDAASATAAAGNASRERVAAMQEAGATQRVGMQIESAWKIAKMEDATRRYISEGDWGVTKWVTEQNNTAAMNRLVAELGFRREELAQRAIEEKNRNEESMKFLAFEVAKYDADLASKPRNWIAYAAWLKNRDVVVDGLSLAMAAQEVPETELDPQETQQATDSTIAATMAGAAGTPDSPGTAINTESTANGGQRGQQNALSQEAQTAAATTATGAGSGTGSPGAQEIADMSLDDFTGYLFGDSSAGPDIPAMQEVMNSLRTTPEGTGSSRSNSLGLNVPEARGRDVDYRKFTQDLSPTQQQMRVGAQESLDGESGAIDWLAEMEKFKPKGNAVGAASYG